jgi:hypothetical protein
MTVRRHAQSGLLDQVDLNGRRYSESPDVGAPSSYPRSYERLDVESGTRVHNLKRSVLICGSADLALNLLPTGTVQTVVTSPPYWSLRDYDDEAQIGRDDSLSDYLASVVQVFDQLRRVLTQDGTVWLNVGDTYTSGNRRYRAPDRKNRARAMSVRPATPDGLKPKDLIGVPWRQHPMDSNPRT